MNLHWTQGQQAPGDSLLVAGTAKPNNHNGVSPVSLAPERQTPRLLEAAWTAVNYALLGLPVVALLLNIYAAEIRAAVTFGVRAVVVSKVTEVFEQAIYTVLSCIIVCTLAILRGFHKRRAFATLVWPALAILSCSLLLDNKMGTVGADSLAEILSTNWREATAYTLQALSTLAISGKQLAVALSPAGFYALLALFAKLVRLRPKLIPAMVSLVLSASALTVLFSRDISRLVSAYLGTQFVQQRMIGATRAELINFTRPRSGPRLVVYLGESTNRELYRALTDRIEAGPFKDNVVLFEQVISPHSHTAPSLLRALTVSDDPVGDQLKYDTELWRANLISVLNHMGVGAEWYSNQGRDEWPAKWFATEANRAHFQEQGWGSSYTGYRKPDAELLPSFLHAIRSPGRGAIFFHSYAGHFPYCENLPAGVLAVPQDVRTRLSFQAAFGDLLILNRPRHLKEINCYDRALAYIAANLDVVMKEMWKAAEPMVLVYFSDHGEDVLDGTGHDSGSATFRKIEVPLVVFFNEAAGRQYRHELDAARANKGIRYSLAWISDSLLDISGLAYKRDLLSIFRGLKQTPDRYSSLRIEHGKRFVIAVDGDRDAQGVASLTNIDLYAKRRLIHSFPGGWQNRICAHRADSWMKFNEASQVFPCLELDLVLDAAARQVYVFHPPKKNTYLTLKDLVSSQPRSWSKLWLDTKNLDRSNAEFYLQYLNELFAPAQRPGILVETSLNNPDDVLVRGMLANFRNSGYGLSYYLPTKDGIRCSQSASADGCSEFADRVVATISNLPFSSLSFDVRARSLAKAIQHRHNIQLNTWDVTVKQPGDIDPELLEEVSMYLIPYRSRFDY